jgi:hypothetical protein
METIFPKEFPRFCCEYCDIKTNNKKDFNNHLLTAKHSKLTIVNKTLTETSHFSQDCVSNNFICDICEKSYKSRVGLWKHKKRCNIEENTKEESIINQSSNTITPELVMELIKNNKELQQIILEQHTTLNNLVKNGISNNNNSLNSNNNHSNNKTFNLQFFLNETCKDAMNIMDFVESIKLQMSDLEKVGEIGYTQGISNIITTNLKALDVTQRPVHCTDKKRETMYIKDEDKWEKEDEQNTKLKKMIRYVENKNIRMLPQFREKYPEYNNSSSKISDKYDKIVLEAMGGAGNNNLEKEEKIIHNISKCVTIDKYIDETD